MSDPIGCLYPWTMLAPGDLLTPYGLACRPVIDYGPGGGGFGALMGRGHFERYEVDGKWSHMKRVRVQPGRTKTRSR